MLNISGIEIAQFPKELTKIGDLIYFQGSLMSVYKDKDMYAYIFDWVESNDSLNRWLVYQTDIKILAEFIKGKYSHFNLINSPEKDLFYLVDKNINGDIVNCKIISGKHIPNQYLPQNDILFDDEDSRNLDSIVSTFRLDEISSNTTNNSKIFDILEEAQRNNSELINLHIKSSNEKVGFGKIRTSILSEVLNSYYKLSKATAINLFDNKGKASEDKVRRKKGELKSIIELADTEYMYSKAASFSVFLKPIKQKIDLFDNTTCTEKITKTVFKLFEASLAKDSLEELKPFFDNGMLTAYNNFLKEIKEQDLTITVQYANPGNSFQIKDVFNPQKANSIMKNLSVLEVSNTHNIKLKGFFKALDSTNYTFKFESLEGDIYIGKFSEQLKNGMFAFNLQSTYQISLEIAELKKAGKANIDEKITMVASIEDKAN